MRDHVLSSYSESENMLIPDSDWAVSAFQCASSIHLDLENKLSAEEMLLARKTCFILISITITTLRRR